MTSPPALDQFIQAHNFKNPVRITGGWAMVCPACGTDGSFRVRMLGNAAAVGCFREDRPAGSDDRDCPGDFAVKLGLTPERWDAELDSIGADAPPIAPTKPKADSRISADDVVTFVEANYRLGRSTDGLTFAVPTYADSNRVAREVRAIRNDVLLRFRDDTRARTGKGVVIGTETMTNALNVVSALAESRTPEPVALRSAQVGDDRVVLDLGDASGQVVEATPAGWAVRPPSDATPVFRRSAAVQPLPEPERGGSLDALRGLLGLDAADRRWLLVRGWLVASVFAEVPRPLLWATGAQGSGKSMRTRMVLSVVEPCDSLGKEPGRNERDDSTAARARFLVSYDNITTVSQSASDWLCRLVTGVTDDRRQLYSDDDLRPVSYRRSGVATSITLPPGLGSDALERIALVPLDRIPDDQRRGESGLWSAFTAARPALLGALLTEVSLVLRHLETVKAEPHARPRMADYADILRALDRGLGLDEDGGHLAAYVGAVDESLADRALDDPFTAAVLTLVERRRGHWRGPAHELRTQLTSLAAADNFDLPKWWPANARAVTSQCEKAQEALRHAGVTYRKGKSSGARYIELTGTVTGPTVPPEGTQPSSNVPPNAAGQTRQRDARVGRDGLPGSHRPSAICALHEEEVEGTPTGPNELPTRTTVPSVPTVPSPIAGPSLDDHL